MESRLKAMIWLLGALLFALLAIFAANPTTSLALLFRVAHKSLTYRETYFPSENNKLSPEARSLNKLLQLLIPPEQPDKPTDVGKARKGVALVNAFIPVRADVATLSLRAGSGPRAVELLLVAPQSLGSLSQHSSLARVVLWFHGGGFVCGRPEMELGLAAELAARLGAVVALAGYRQAPEHTLADALADAAAALDYLTQTRGVAASRLALGGSSAGALLALLLLNERAVRGQLLPAAMWLHSLAPFDYAQLVEPPRWLSVRNHAVARDPALTAAGWAHLCAHAARAPASLALLHRLLRASPAGLPPTLLSSGGADLVLSGVQYHYQRLLDANVSATLHVGPLLPHGYVAWASLLPEAVQELQSAADWLQSRIRT